MAARMKGGNNREPELSLPRSGKEVGEQVKEVGVKFDGAVRANDCPRSNTADRANETPLTG